MALWPPALADASSFCPTENSQPVLSHTLKAQEHKNAMSQRSCRAKIFVRPASHLHCNTKRNLRMSMVQVDRRAGPQEREGWLDARRRQGPHQAHGVADDLRTGRHRDVVSHPTAAVTLVGTPQSCHGHAP